jgi:Patatin-like phospholipase
MAGPSEGKSAESEYTEHSDRVLFRRQKAINNCTAESLPGLWGDLDQRREFFKNHHIRTGLAFSGGGIRSATISLGLTQALAVCGRLYAFDMMSTVSGGGYFGSFLRSLYIDRDEDEGIVTNREKMADDVLLSLPDTQYFRGRQKAREQEQPPHRFLHDGVKIKSPLWWLRENGRYLAPNGASDYGFAVVYAVRNWLTLMAMMLVALICLFAAVQGLLLLTTGLPAVSGKLLEYANDKPPVSPLFVLLPGFVLIAAGIGLGYWLPARSTSHGDKSLLSKNRLMIAFLAAMAVVGIALAAKSISQDSPIAIAIAIVLLSSVAVSLGVFKGNAGKDNVRFQLEYRRSMTRALTQWCGYGLCAVAALAVIDSFALMIIDHFDDGGWMMGSATISGTVAASLFAWLTAKIPGWFDGKTGKIVEFARKHVSLAAFMVGIMMALLLAVSADLLVLNAIWAEKPWQREPGFAFDPAAIGAMVATALGIFVLINRSHDLLNLTAFTPLYGSRLTRSYLGATNVKRQKQTKDQSGRDIVKGMASDEIELKHYMVTDTAAPMHLINVTLNRTVGAKKLPPDINVDHDDPLLLDKTSNRPRGRIASYESQLALRDRKGDRMVIGPEGIRAGAQWFDWQKLNKVELPKLGQFCAISGAAVGSGMGRMTTLGTALALTMANVRLGHWWNRPHDARNNHGPAPRQYLQPYRNLFSELLGLYSRDSSEWMLSDGGHSENTGVLSLLERGCKFILACDNGQDPDYSFADLEILIRTARTDLGIEIDIVKTHEFPGEMDAVRDCFFNGTTSDWRREAKEQEKAAFALLLQAEFIRSVSADGDLATDSPPAFIVWIKPSNFKGLPADLATYAELNPDFPQQSTSNQFFGEAQWESYRRLGFHMGRALFTNRSAFGGLVPMIRHNID